MRLIDADKLKDKFISIADTSIWCAFCNEVNNAPTIDLAERDRQIRADAIYEAIHIADCSHTDCWDCAFGEADICKLQQFYGQLKEQNNE